MTTTTDTALTDEAINSHLSDLPGWRYADNKISRVFDNPSYTAGLSFVQHIGELAEQHDHHPDITLTWPTTTVTYWTHTANGVTQKDIDAAKQVSLLYQQL